MSEPEASSAELDQLAEAAAAHAASPWAAGREVVDRRVGFFPRLGAALLDVLVMLPLLVVYVATVSYLEDQGRLTWFMGYAVTLAGGLFGLLYTALEVFFAATPGKMILRQRIANADGTAADGWTLFNRWLYKNGGSVLTFLSVVTMIEPIDWLGDLWGLVILVGCFFAFQTSRQAWHDRWARTAVYPREVLTVRGFEPLGVQVAKSG